MILCMNCGKQELFVRRENSSRLILFDENEKVKESTKLTIKYGEPRCPKCGRRVKFFKDEVEE